MVSDKQISPVVSVLMIAYNKDKYIDEAIAGVVRQKTDFPVELIIMDDCSTDSTPSIIEKWRTEYPDVIKAFRNPVNLGLQRNYMEGFRHCNGKYLAICDADDYWFDRNKLSRQVGYMETHDNCAITFHRMINYYESSGEKSLSNGGQPEDTDIRNLSRSNFITNSSVMYRRGLVDLINLPDWIKDDRSPDYAFHMLYAAKGVIHYFRKPMGVYRKTEGSSWSTTGRFKQLYMSLKVRLNLIKEFSDNNDVKEGLFASVTGILEAMAGCVSTDIEKQILTEQAESLGVDLSKVVPRPAPKKSLLSRTVRFVSKFMPLPRP